MSSRRVRANHVRPTLTSKAGEVHVRPSRRSKVRLYRPLPLEETTAQVSPIAFLALALVIPDPAVAGEFICPDQVGPPVA